MEYNRLEPGEQAEHYLFCVCGRGKHTEGMAKMKPETFITDKKQAGTPKGFGWTVWYEAMAASSHHCAFYSPFQCKPRQSLEECTHGTKSMA